MKLASVLLILSVACSKEYFLIAQTIIEGTTTTSTVTGDWSGVTVAHSTPTTYTYRNNSVTSVNASGYMLQAGDEIVNSGNNNLRGETITGNRFTWNGTDASSITHGIFTGYQLDVNIKYNYLDKVPMSIIRKSNGMTNTTGAVAYNIVKNPVATAVVVKGMNNVCIYNNTFYSNKTGAETWRALVQVYSNDTPVAASTGTRIKNNIFYTVNQIYNITINDANCVAGFESDYNVFYCEKGTPYFNYVGSGKTFAQWQALGYDLHSVVINPNFNNTTDFVPASRLNYGMNLGTDYAAGLSAAASWTVGSLPQTTNQDATWQAGARVLGTSPPAANVYYVSPTGNDANPGTIELPFFSIQKGVNTVTAGGTVYVRGGVYYPAPTVGYSGSNGVYINKSGTSANIYKLYAYPGEYPVIDCRNFTGTTYGRNAILVQGCSYWHIKGIEVARADQTQSPVHGAAGIWMENCNNITIENCKAHHIGGGGFGVKTQSGNNTNFINCDSYSNYDPYSTQPGDNADGFTMGYCAGDYTINLTGCRSWDNSDDGFDCFQGSGYSSVYTFKNCWAWHNGYVPGTDTPAGQGIQGCGFKLGDDPQANYSITRRFLYNCIAYDNLTRGFSQESARVKKEIYNCIAYANHTHGFSFYGYDVPDILRNNASFGNAGQSIEQEGTVRTSDHNTWDLNITPTSADFMSVNGSELASARNIDGSLPQISFLRLVGTSQLIDKGVSIGLPYNGVAPDLAAFEYTSGYSTLGKIIKSNNKLIRK